MAAGDALRGYLYGVGPLDPIALGAVLALLGVAAVAPTLLPLRRAVRTDPAVQNRVSARHQRRITQGRRAKKAKGTVNG